MLRSASRSSHTRSRAARRSCLPCASLQRPGRGQALAVFGCLPLLGGAVGTSDTTICAVDRSVSGPGQSCIREARCTKLQLHAGGDVCARPHVQRSTTSPNHSTSPIHSCPDNCPGQHPSLGQAPWRGQAQQPAHALQAQRCEQAALRRCCPRLCRCRAACTARQRSRVLRMAVRKTICGPGPHWGLLYQF